MIFQENNNNDGAIIMPSTAPATNTETTEDKSKQAGENYANRLLKTELKTIFNNYINSKAGLFNFRSWMQNSALKAEKKKLAEDVIKFIDKFEGTKSDLIKGLEDFRVQNSDLSIDYNKFHPNLLEEDKIPISEDSSLMKSATGRSALADAFANAIQKVKDYELDNISAITAKK